MKSPRRHFMFLPLALALMLPFAFNACQAGLFGGKGFNSASSSASCKPVMYKGQVQKLSDFPLAPNPFANGKVQLKETGASVQGKAETLTIKAGTELSFVADNACLNEHAQGMEETVISKLAVGKSFAQLPTQAYIWKLDRDYTDSELSAIADKESCIVGLSWNREYKLMAYNDQGRFNQGHLDAIKADESYPYYYNSEGGMDQATGAPVKVAVIDTGVDWQHPDLTDNLWRHSLGIGIDITTIAGPVSYDPTDISSIGHGTHVSGLIAAMTNNSIGVSGAMPFRAQILPIKLFASNGQGGISTTSQHFANAIQFAYQNGAKVINLSVGNITAGPNTDAVAEQAVNAAVNNGAVVVVVIGNAENGLPGAQVNGTTLTSIPGMYATRPGVIGVGSFDVQTGLRSNFSHFSTTYAEISAPGADLNLTGIYSTLPRSQSSYGRLAGTSQAAPLVAAAAALAMGIIKDATNVYPSPQEVERLLLASAEKAANLTSFFKDGNKLNLHRLAQRINVDYPATQSGNSVDLSSVGCP